MGEGQADQSSHARTVRDRKGASIRSQHASDHAHQVVRRDRRILGWHGIAASYEMILLNPHHAMDEKPVQPCEQHNRVDVNLVERARLNGQAITGPEAGQHAVTESGQLHLSGGAKNLNRECLLDVLPRLGTFRHEGNV
jgi:hypothetical protein